MSETSDLFYNLTGQAIGRRELGVLFRGDGTYRARSHWSIAPGNIDLLELHNLGLCPYDRDHPEVNVPRLVTIELERGLDEVHGIRVAVELLFADHYAGLRGEPSLHLDHTSLANKIRHAIRKHQSALRKDFTHGSRGFADGQLEVMRRFSHLMVRDGGPVLVDPDV